MQGARHSCAISEPPHLLRSTLRTGILMYRWVALLLMGVLVGLQYQLWFGVGGVGQVHRLERSVAQQQIANAQLALRNERLAAEVADLKTGREAVEERARLELGMVRPDEVFYQLVEAPRPVDPLR
jgi:cell division protein FtsB